MLRVGLTGGIASGKSAVANLFKEHGAAVIDTDQLARDVTAPGSDGLEAIRQTFGNEYVTDEGELDRARLRRHIFSSSHERQRLEAIVHPRVQKRLEETLKGLDAPYAIIVVPLLVETGMQRDMDRVLVVDCPQATQIERLQSRDGETESGAHAILASQANRDERLAAADDVIANDSDFDALRNKVKDLHESYLLFRT